MKSKEKSPEIIPGFSIEALEKILPKLIKAWRLTDRFYREKSPEKIKKKSYKNALNLLYQRISLNLNPQIKKINALTTLKGRETFTHNKEPLFKLLSNLQTYFQQHEYFEIIEELKKVFTKEILIPHKLEELLGEILSNVSSRAPYKPPIRSFFTIDIMIELVDLLKCIMRGYFSFSLEDLINKIVEFFDLIVSLDELCYWHIMSEFRLQDISLNQMENRPKQAKKFFHDQVFGLYSHVTYTVRIINGKLKIRSLIQYEIPSIFGVFNRKNYRFMLNINKIIEDRAYDKKYFLNLVKYYLSPTSNEPIKNYEFSRLFKTLEGRKKYLDDLRLQQAKLKEQKENARKAKFLIIKSKIKVMKLLQKKVKKVDFQDLIDALYCPFCGAPIDNLEKKKDIIVCKVCNEKCRIDEFRQFL